MKFYDSSDPQCLGGQKFVLLSLKTPENFPEEIIHS